MIEGIKIFILDMAIRGLLLLIAFGGLFLYNHSEVIHNKNQLLEILPPYEVGYIFIFSILLKQFLQEFLNQKISLFPFLMNQP